MEPLASHYSIILHDRQLREACGARADYQRQHHQARHARARDNQGVGGAVRRMSEVGRKIALAAIALAAAAMSNAGIAHSNDAETTGSANVIVTANGPVRGTTSTTTITFLGVPYAESPVRDARWRPPQPHGRWSGILDATQFGKHCPQLPPTADANASEDCLFLNIYVPRLQPPSYAVAGRPVMVWIHGGANAGGASEIYDPRSLVDTGNVIVVSINYRLGPLGFLAHPTLAAEGAGSGNFGIMDQQLALEWVRTNIAMFGGDPQKVTVFGESSGGLNTIVHLVSPRSAGLFQRAIVQSGAYQPNAATRSASEKLGIAFANAMGCSDQSTVCLRSRPLAEVLANGTSAFNQSTIDGDVLPESPLSAIVAGHINHVPVIQGVNSHEGRFFFPPDLTEAGYLGTATGVAGVSGKSINQILSTYPLDAYPSAFEATSALFGDAAFACTAGASSLLLANSVPTYMYEFNDAAASPRGAMHTAELRYFFDLNLGGASVGPASLAAPSQRLAAHMRAYWTRFASAGNPNSADAPEWQRVSDGQVQLLTPPSPAGGSFADYGARHKCAFWSA
jgi:para-nitrobenzyl esterase